MTGQDRDELDEIVETINGRGHAAMFARGGAITKEMVEVGTAREWAESMRREFGMNISQVNFAGADHPDCNAALDDRKISLELTELVNELVLRCRAQERRGGLSPENLFDKTQWNFENFSSAIVELISRKNGKYSKQNMKLDALIIHTDEDWLSPYDIEKWVARLEIEPPSSIRSVYLLRTYFPGYRDWWPIFRLFGTL